MFEYLLFSVPVMRTVWRRALDWMLFVRECVLYMIVWESARVGVNKT
jgi:hypothetical protein